MSKESKEIYEFGPFRLDVGEHLFQRIDGAQNVPLPEKAFQTLVILLRNQGRLVTKAELLDAVWPDSFVEENNLDKAIHAIRHTLGEKAAVHKYVETVRKHGYRFVAAVTRIEAEDDKGLRRSENGATFIGPLPKHQITESGQHALVDLAEWRELIERAETKYERLKPVTGERIERSEKEHDDRVSVERTYGHGALPDSRGPVVSRAMPLVRRGWLIAAGGVIALLGLLFVLNAGGLRERAFGKAAEPVQIRSLAVLPLKDLSDGGAQAYFVDGITDALINDLARIDALRVVSAQSAMRNKESRQTPSDIGRELNVDAVLTGSVTRAGERVRVAVRLMNVATDRNLWEQSYERNLTDILELQHEIARTVAREIRVKLTPQEQLRFGSAAAVKPEAYDNYLRGKFYLNRQNKDDNAIAIASLETAVTADPSFAAAHAELALAYAWKLFLFDPNDKTLAANAFVEVEKALAIDPELAVAYLARGRLLWTPANRFPSEKAIREYRRALELNPNLDEARNQLALIYNHVGALDEALRELSLALETNPHNSLAEFRVAETKLFQGKYEEALSGLRKVPDDTNRALVGHQIVWALYNLGRKEEAVIELERFLKEFPDDNRGLITSQQAVLAAAAGKEKIAEEKIRLAIENGEGFGHFHHTAYFIACAYALMDKPERAVEWLEYAADNGFPNYPLFERDESLQKIKLDPRFIAFLAKLKPQWERFKTLA